MKDLENPVEHCKLLPTCSVFPKRFCSAKEAVGGMALGTGTRPTCFSFSIVHEVSRENRPRTRSHRGCTQLGPSKNSRQEVAKEKGQGGRTEEPGGGLTLLLICAGVLCSPEVLSRKQWEKWHWELEQRRPFLHSQSYTSAHSR
eukprot:CAMPEP_0196661088 /NCGR_PEP_ID=MMETSP1086-20130531/42579_1 /TAXON_ID=77921 /ORGANISM="Cyanoptyche  gloeocystis , Strain SAG4.97" /LENGTH=143 /DNA_ID=CAMNT_0041995829 /DNA_START=507 /DNA_END=934 /DNA_ORIENTATION=-